ncbi:zinc-ribbon domain-containing protein [Maribacter sp.]|uniref:zinc-ribbon domain-containing protein n=1 Tax=Maribacter sp. TaxID=1897614 RepID=UPI003C73E124
MKVFQCGHCNHPLFFENYTCENCGHLSGYRDLDRQMPSFDPFRSSLLSDRENIVKTKTSTVTHAPIFPKLKNSEI